MPIHWKRQHPWKNFQVSQDLRGLAVALTATVHATSWSVFLFALVFINNCLILGVSCFQLRWTEPLSSAVITFTTSRSTTDSKSATRQSLPIAPQHIVSRLVMSWLLVSADLSQRQCASMSSARKCSVLKVTSRKPSFSSEEWAADILQGLPREAFDSLTEMSRFYPEITQCLRHEHYVSDIEWFHGRKSAWEWWLESYCWQRLMPQLAD